MTESSTATPIATLSINSRYQGHWNVPVYDGQSLRIGREESNDIWIDDPAVSRTHAFLSASDTGLAIVDNASTNGIFVNSERISAITSLNSSDVIDIGSAKITVELHHKTGLKDAGDQRRSRAMTAQMTPVPVTIMVVTVQNFHQLGRDLSGSDFSQTMHKWKETVRNIVIQNGGRIDKTAGGSTVAIWIGSSAVELARSACTAGLKIREASRTVQASNPEPSGAGAKWKATVVFSSGLGLKGSAGTSSEFTILGDPTSLAFKLEALVGKLGEDLILCEFTSELVKKFWKPRKVINVKIREDESLGVYSIDRP